MGSLGAWLSLPDTNWSTTLYATSVATVSAIAAIYGAWSAGWESDLRRLIERRDRYERGDELLKAKDELAAHLGRDMRGPVGLIALALSIGLAVCGTAATLGMESGQAWAFLPLAISFVAVVYLVLVFGNEARRQARAGAAKPKE